MRKNKKEYMYLKSFVVKVHIGLYVLTNSRGSAILNVVRKGRKNNVKTLS